MKAVCYVEWTEIEFGWGDRPDGISFHENVDAANNYIRTCHAKNNQYFTSIAGKIQFLPLEGLVYDASVKNIKNGNGTFYSYKNNLEEALNELTQTIER